MQGVKALSVRRRQQEEHGLVKHAMMILAQVVNLICDLYWGIGDFGNSSNVIGTWVAQVIMRYYSAPFDALLIKMVQD